MNVLALCAGVGGLELGIRIAEPRSRGVCYVEREAYAAAILATRMEEGWLHPAPIWADLGTFDPEPWRGIVHCIASGDPCQPNSVAGKRLGKEDDRWLLDRVLAIVEAIRPDRFFRENVPGNAAGQLEAIVPALEGMGYRVAAGIFSAAECGASHRRERLFIMGHAIGCRYDGKPQGPRRGSIGGTSIERPGGRISESGMANPGGAGCEGGEQRNPLPGNRNGPEASGSITELCSPLLANAQGQRWVEGRAEFQGWIGIDASIDGGLPIFAPGPDDPRWAEIIDAARRLNPQFVEWLMGWPIGWTACGPLETAYSPWLRRMRTHLWMLCLARAETEQPDLLAYCLPEK